MSRRKSNPTAIPPPGTPRRLVARIYDDPRHDPYQASGKYSEPTRCDVCGAAYHRGRWQWTAAPTGARSATCPACRRVQDQLPAGRLTVRGPYAAAHRIELLQLVRNQAEHERAEHALNRIMDTIEHADSIEITTTDIHLPRRIGEALKRAHDGTLDIHFSEDAYEIRVVWNR